MDKIVNVKELPARGITLTNAKGKSSIQCAEFVIVAFLHFAKDFTTFQNLKKERKWRPDHPRIPCLFRKNLTIIGTGSIGQEIAKMAKHGFNMNVSGVRNNLNLPKPETFDQMYHFKDMGSAVSDADYIVSALPFTPLTTNLVNGDVFK